VKCTRRITFVEILFAQGWFLIIFPLSPPSQEEGATKVSCSQPGKRSFFLVAKLRRNYYSRHIQLISQSRTSG
jgi:hypothetical protein